MMYALETSADAVERRLDAARMLAKSPMPVRQVDALNGWISVAQEMTVTRAHLKPALFGRTLQFVTLVEILESGDDYRHVIEGREVVRWFGKAGKEPFSALYAPEYLTRLRAFYRTVQMTGRPNRSDFMVMSIDEEELAFSQLVLPAMDERGVVNCLAIVMNFPDPLRRIPGAPLRIYAPWRQLHKGTATDTMLGDYNWR